MHHTPGTILNNELELRRNIFPLLIASHRRESSTLKPIIFYCFTQVKRIPFHCFTQTKESSFGLQARQKNHHTSNIHGLVLTHQHHASNLHRLLLTHLAHTLNVDLKQPVMKEIRVPHCLNTFENLGFATFPFKTIQLRAMQKSCKVVTKELGSIQIFITLRHALHPKFNKCMALLDQSHNT